jgi:hypothetical protein
MGTTSTIPLFGRSYNLQVKFASSGQSATQEVWSQKSWEPEALRITFDVLQSTLPSPYWFADISIYNLNGQEIQNAIYNATWATLSAGFQEGPSKSSIIWDGPVLQTLFERVDVVDFKITLHCLATIPLLNESIMNFAVRQYGSQADLVTKMVSEIGAPFNVSMSTTAKSLLSAKKYPRGKTVFGKVSKFLYEMSDDQFLGAWMDSNQAYFSALSEGKVNPDLIYSAPYPAGYIGAQVPAGVTQSIIGVPRQTPFGVNFTVLLDPRLVVKVPPLLVEIDRTVIAQMKVQYPGIMTPIDAHQRFIAAQIRHRGDSRGDDWQTEITGYNETYAQNILKGVLLPVAQGNT